MGHVARAQPSQPHRNRGLIGQSWVVKGVRNAYVIKALG